MSVPLLPQTKPDSLPAGRHVPKFSCSHSSAAEYIFKSKSQEKSSDQCKHVNRNNGAGYWEQDCFRKSKVEEHAILRPHNGVGHA